MTKYMTAQGFYDAKENLRIVIENLTQFYAQHDGAPQQQFENARDSMQLERIEAARQEQIMLGRISDLQIRLANAVIVDPPTTNTHLRIGTIAILQHVDARLNPIGSPVRYLIGGYGESDATGKPPVIAYDAPIVAQLLGKDVDADREPAEVHLRGKTIYVQLVGIELPRAERKLKAVA